MIDDINGLREIPSGSIDPARQKKAHHKSRGGCSNCRKRRVKCDEKRPKCSHCLRREEECEQRVPHIRHSPGPSLPQPISPPALIDGTSPVINMMHMKLFHHFETSTRHTLCFQSVWKEAIGWSLEYEALMHAILSISARHLAYLCPNEPKYGIAATAHFTKTLSMFRKDINERFTAFTMDPVMATSVLIFFELWMQTEFVVKDSNGRDILDLSQDTIFRLAGGLVEIFLSANSVIYEKPSSFLAEMVYSPRLSLNSVAHLSKEKLASLYSFFSYTQPLRYEQLSITSALASEGHPNSQHSESIGIPAAGEEDDIFLAHKDVVSRLAVIIPFLPEVRGQEPEAPNVSDLARYAFTFLILIYPYAERAISRQDPKGLLLLYHFYRAVRILLGSSNCWWTHRRARLLEPLLEARLRTEFEGCS
ncbi:hypothetical protein P154DRAFT_421197 [Amniculicola lignicola CBS 123094]|uniref:Zn(2)-C6 fungal-type domain-containing protein n=1 Tax=Amniculicola lignicola CBS 123094 TaxID=1392246 RepID=A0A6A5X1G4_9PLEO|nr:hypothetical protein P154DRAFT_421197 [Amniculicola lignicola CBS 123094]